MKQRTSIFDAEPEADFDVSSFKPAKEPRGKAPRDAVRAVASAANFTSREAAPEPAAPTAKKVRRRRTGRTVQFNARTTPATYDAFYAIADEQGWLISETVERALAALQRELGTKR